MCTLNSNKIKESLDLLAEYCLTDTGILYILLQIKQCHAVLCSHEKYMKYIHTVVSSNILQTVANLTHTLTKAVQNCGMPADSGDLAHHWSVALCAFLFFFFTARAVKATFSVSAAPSALHKGETRSKWKWHYSPPQAVVPSSVCSSIK